MISKNEFLIKNKLEIMKKAKNKWFYSSDFGISKKRMNGLISEIFDYLSQDDVYVNIYDVNFVELIMKDLNDSILNFISLFDDYEFMGNFKESIRHQPNKERDRLMELVENILFEKFRPLLDLIRNNNTEKGGRPPFDPVLMLKTNFIRVYYNLSDEKTARRIRSDDACQCFLSYPDKYPM